MTRRQGRNVALLVNRELFLLSQLLINSFFKQTASLAATIHYQAPEVSPQQAHQTIQPQLRAAALKTDTHNTVHSDSMPPASPGSKESPQRDSSKICPWLRALPDVPSIPFLPAWFVLFPPPPAYPTHHQMLISEQHCTFTQVSKRWGAACVVWCKTKCKATCC